MFKCENNHHFGATLRQLQERKCLCQECYKDEQTNKARVMAAERGGVCCSRYERSIDDMEWKCSHGHIIIKSFNDIQNGMWCIECSDKKPITIEDAIKHAKAHDGYCLSSEYSPTKKLKWRCNRGHEWPAYFKRCADNWCRKCADQNGIEERFERIVNDINKEIKRRGWILIKPYKDWYTRLEMKCARKHPITMSVSNFLHGRHKSNKCMECELEDLRYTLADVQQMAHKNGGRCLEEEYKNVGTKMRFQCKDGHTWDTTFSKILIGRWCPDCNSSGKVVRKKMKKVLSNIFTNNKIEINKRGFDWLKDRGKMEIDFWLPHIKLGIEYDGRHHYEPVDWAGKGEEWAENNLKEVQFRDALKDELISQHPKEIKYFIRIPYTEEITKENIIKILAEHNVPITKGD